jgi:hypothetical protein
VRAEVGSPCAAASVRHSVTCRVYHHPHWSSLCGKAPSLTQAAPAHWPTMAAAVTGDSILLALVSADGAALGARHVYPTSAAGTVLDWVKETCGWESRPGILRLYRPGFEGDFGLEGLGALGQARVELVPYMFKPPPSPAEADPSFKSGHCMRKFSKVRDAALQPGCAPRRAALTCAGCPPPRQGLKPSTLHANHDNMVRKGSHARAVRDVLAEEADQDDELGAREVLCEV